MSKHANRPHKPGRKDFDRAGNFVHCSDGLIRRTTTMPWRKGKDGKRERIREIEVRR